MKEKVDGARERNERAVLRELLAAGDVGVTRPELASRLGLSAAAIAALVRGRIAPILQRDLIERPRRGRRPESLRIASDAGCTVGLDFGQTYMAAGVFDLQGEELRNRAYVDVGAGTDAASALRWMHEQVEAMAIGADSVVGVGISIAAPVFRDPPVLRQDMFSMPDWSGRDPAQELRDMLGWDCPFALDNDANLGALAELRRGAARDRRDVIFLKWTWGIGAALIIEGDLRRGRGIAGEIGHIEVTLDAEHGLAPPPLCRRCGRHCLQTVAAMPLVLEDAAIPTAGERANLHPSVEELVRRIRSGDERARTALERGCRYVGQALGAAITILNPEAVIIGGDLNADSYDLFAPPLLDSVRAHSTRSAFADVSLLAGQQTGRASMLGAATWSLDEHLLEYLMRRADRLGGQAASRLP